MITVKAGNYTEKEIAIVPEIATQASTYICENCEVRHSCDDSSVKCPYSHILYDLLLVSSKYKYCEK